MFICDYADCFGQTISLPTLQTEGDWSDLEDLISDKLGEEAVQDPDAVVKKNKSKKRKSNSPLAKLSPEELEKLGMEAVEEGVEPTKLQQAYASAQVPVMPIIKLAEGLHLVNVTTCFVLCCCFCSLLCSCWP